MRTWKMDYLLFVFIFFIFSNSVEFKTMSNTLFAVQCGSPVSTGSKLKPSTSSPALTPTDVKVENIKVAQVQSCEIAIATVIKSNPVGELYYENYDLTTEGVYLLLSTLNPLIRIFLFSCFTTCCLIFTLYVMYIQHYYVLQWIVCQILGGFIGYCGMKIFLYVLNNYLRQLTLVDYTLIACVSAMFMTLVHWNKLSGYSLTFYMFYDACVMIYLLFNICTNILVYFRMAHRNLPADYRIVQMQMFNRPGLMSQYGLNPIDEDNIILDRYYNNSPNDGIEEALFEDLEIERTKNQIQTFWSIFNSIINFIKFLLYPFIWIHRSFWDAWNTYLAAKQVVEQTRDMFKEYKESKVAKVVANSISQYNEFKYILNNPGSEIAVRKKLAIIEIKSICHMLYYASIGQKMAALGWASNFGITRPEDLMKIIMSFWGKASVNYTNNNQYMDYTYNGIKYSLPPEMWEKYRLHFEETKEKWEPEAKYRVVTTENLDMVSMISTLFGLFKIDNMTATDIRSANQSFTYIHNIRKNADEGMKFVTALVSVVCRYFNFDPFDGVWQTFVVSILKSVDHMDAIIAYSIADRAKMEVIDEIIEFYGEVTEIRKNPAMDTIGKSLSKIFFDRYKQVEMLYIAAKGNKFGSRERKTPTFALFAGKGGSGKSGSLQLITKCMIRERFNEHMRAVNANEVMYDPTIQPTFTADAAYYVNFEDQFWSGYHNQRFVFLDDIFECEATEDKKIQAKQIIHLVNTIALPLNMASIEEKGNTYFDSEYMFATTNLDVGENFEQCQMQLGLNSQQSVTRRMHIVFKRDDKGEANAVDNTFKVMACELFPRFVGQIVTTMQAYDLITMVRKRQLELAENYIYPPEVLDDYLNNHIKLETKKYVRRTDPPNDEQGSYIVTECIRMKVYEWWDSPNRDYYITLTALLLTVPIMIAIYMFMFPEKTEIERQMDAMNTIKMQAKGIDYDKKKRSGKTVPNVTTNLDTWRDVNFHKSEVNNNNTLSDYRDVNMQSSVGYYDQLRNHVAKSMVYIVGGAMINEKFVYEAAAVCFHLHKRKFCVPDHFFSNFATYKDVRFVMRWKDKSEKDQIVSFQGPIKGIRRGDSDLVVFDLPESIKCNNPPNSYGYLSQQPHLQIPAGTTMQLITIDAKGVTQIRDLTKVSYLDNLHYGYDSLYFIECPIVSLGHTIAGDSGAIIAIKGENDRPIIVGMHVCSMNLDNKHVCVCIPLSARYFGVDDYMEVTMQCNDFPLEILRQVNMNMSNFYPTNHKYRPTALHGIFGPETFKPARLRPFEFNGEHIDPFRIAAKKLHQDVLPCDLDEKDSIDLLMYYFPRRESKVYTSTQAICGIEGELTPLNAGTSMGYPWTKEFSNGKRQVMIMGTDGRYTVDSNFLAVIDRYDDKLKEGLPIEAIFADALKPELRPNDKVDQGKTRLFSVGPVHHTILMRMYFQDFFEYMKTSCVNGPSAVGINPTSLAWTQLYERLNRKKGSVISGDFSNFDGSLSAAGLKIVVAFINHWYNDGPTNARIRCLLFENIYHAVRICGVTVYQLKGGVPSGVGGTTYINCLYLILAMHKVLSKRYKLNVTDYEMTCYGDDSVITTDIEGIRCSDLAADFKTMFGMTYTHWSKEEHNEHDTLLDIRYLGRKFQRERGLMKAPLEERVVLEIPYYSEVGEAAYMAFLDSFFQECFQLGPDFYVKYTTILLNELHRVRPHLYLLACNKRLPYGEFESMCYYGKPEVPSDWRNVKVESKTFAKGNPSSNLMERALHDLKPDQDLELGNSSAIGEVDKSATAPVIYQDPYKGFQFTEQELKHLLSRDIKVGTGTWSTALGNGAIQQTLNFPDVLFADAFLTKIYSNFRWFRAGIRVTVSLAANPFFYGIMQILSVSNPLALPGGVASFIADSTIGSGFPGMLLAAQEGGTIILDMPFINKYRALNIQSYTAGEMGAVVFQVLNQLRDTTGTYTSVTTTITAQFIDPQIFGNIALTSNEDVEFPDYRHVRLESNEANKKAEAGSISSQLDGVLALTAKIDEIPLVAPYSNIFNQTGKALSKGLKMAGLSKPNSLQVGQITTLDPFCVFNDGHGIETARKLGVDAENAVTTLPEFAGECQDDMDVKKIMGTPMMIYTASIASTAVNTTIVLDTPESYSNNYYDNFRKCFAYYTGSTKYMLIINASMYHNIEAVLWFNPSTSTAVRWQDACHKKIQISGLTKVNCMVPFCSASMGLKRNLTNSTLRFTVLSWSNANTVLNIEVNVYKAGGSDVQVSCPLDMIYIESNEDANFESLLEDYRDVVLEVNPRAEFLQEFDPFENGNTGVHFGPICHGEQITHLSQIIKRSMPYYQHTETNDRYIYNVVGHTNDTSTVDIGLEFYGKVFYMYHRGGITFKMVGKNNNTATTASMYATVPGDNYVIAGLSVTSANNPILQATIPYWDSQMYRNNRTAQDGTNSNDGIYMEITVTNPLMFGFKSAADDFTFVGLMPCANAAAIVPLTKADLTFGYQGYRLYLTPSAIMVNMAQKYVQKQLQSNVVYGDDQIIDFTSPYKEDPPLTPDTSDDDFEFDPETYTMEQDDKMIENLCKRIDRIKTNPNHPLHKRVMRTERMHNRKRKALRATSPKSIIPLDDLDIVTKNDGTNNNNASNGLFKIFNR